MFHGHLDYFQQPPLGGRPSTRPEDHGTRNTHNRWFILFYHVWELTWIEIHWNGIWLRAGPGHIWLHTTLEGPWPHHMILEVSWEGLQTLSLRLSQFHNFMVMALGSCVLSGPHSRQPLSYFVTILSKTYVAKQLNRKPLRCWTNFHHEIDSIRFDSALLFVNVVQSYPTTVAIGMHVFMLSFLKDV